MSAHPTSSVEPEARTRILLVEDDPTLGELTVDALQRDGFAVDWLRDGRGVVASVRRAAPAAVLLDLVLPGQDGLSICRELRQFSLVPLIMVTSRVEEVDRLLGLEIGADDYICKPFGVRELVARVRALLRRAQLFSAPSKALPGRGLHLDEDAFIASWDGQALDLTPVEFRLLHALSRRPGHVLSRNQLLDAIHSDYRAISDRTVDSHIKNLRRKLAEAQPERELIESVYGVGYRLLPSE